MLFFLFLIFFLFIIFVLYCIANCSTTYDDNINDGAQMDYINNYNDEQKNNF